MSCSRVLTLLPRIEGGAAVVCPPATHSFLLCKSTHHQNQRQPRLAGLRAVMFAGKTADNF
jgi:hypothetical protein